MTKILDIIPDNAGGQLKFRVDDIDCRYTGHDDIPANGAVVEIYLREDGSLRGMPKDIDMSYIIHASLTFGRPKGFGVVMWTTGAMSKVMWSPYIGDEGYFKDE